MRKRAWVLILSDHRGDRIIGRTYSRIEAQKATRCMKHLMPGLKLIIRRV